jgi:hypothetical protein
MQVLPQNDVQIVCSTVNDYPFVFSTDNYGAINHLNHPTAPGVANWKGDGNSGGLKSLGDDGSVHQIMAVRDLTDEEIQDIEYAFTLTNPKTGTEYVLYDAAHKVFLDINNLATAPQQAVCTELATLNIEKQSLYITAEGLSWKIHTATGKYLGQYTDANQWNSKVNEDQSEFAWTSNPVLENGNIFIMLQNTSGKQNGFLGNEGHANGSALFVNQDVENRKLKLKLHEASLVYKVITTETNGAAVYEGKNYTNGEYIFANATLTDADRVSANSVMLGLVLLAEAEDTAATNSVNRLSQIQDNEFARAKAIAEYEQKIKEGVRNVVIGADLLCGELGNKPELFAFVDKDRFNKAAAAVLEKDELPENYLAELAGVTGATHAVYGTVSDLRTSVKKFTGYGITTENTLYELDLIIKVLDLNSGRIIYAKTSTGKVKVTNNDNVVCASSSDNFALALNDAVRQAGKELAAFVAKSDKK